MNAPELGFVLAILAVCQAGTSQASDKKISPFSQQLAYCEAVNLYVARYRQLDGNQASAQVALRKWSKLIAANFWLNAEDGEVSEATYNQFREASKDQIEIWNANPNLALTAADSCEPYVEEGWKRAAVHHDVRLDGRTLEEWRAMMYRALGSKMGIDGTGVE